MRPHLVILPTAAAVLISVPAGAVTYMSVEEAKRESFPQADQFVEANIMFTAEQKASLEKALETKIEGRGQQIWRAQKGNELLGYFFLDYVIGKHELIDYSVALTPKGEIIAVDLLTYRESYGSEVSNKGWRKQFIGKSWETPVKFNYTVMNIGGATLSCRHVTEGVQKVLAIYETMLKSKS